MKKKIRKKTTAEDTTYIYISHSWLCILLWREKEESSKGRKFSVFLVIEENEKIGGAIKVF